MTRSFVTTRTVLASLAVCTLAAACGSVSQPATTTTSLAPRHIAAGAFVPLARPPAAIPNDAALAVGSDGVLLFSGTDLKVGAYVGYGAAYSFASDEWTETGEWPFDRPVGAGAVAIGQDRYVVVGMPCPRQAASQDETTCGQPVRAAMFDAANGEWSKLPSPDPGPAINEARSAVVLGLGMSNGQALFKVSADEVQVVAAFDIDAQRWSMIAFPDGYALSNNDSNAESSNLVCMVRDTLVAARIGTAVRTWVLAADRTWDGPADHPIANLKQTINEFLCDGSTLLFTVAGGPKTSFDRVDAFEVSARRWDSLPPPPTKNYEPTIGIATDYGTRILWPTALDDDIYTLAEGAQSWTLSAKPISTSVHMYTISPSVAERAVLVQTNTERGTPLLGFYGL